MTGPLALQPSQVICRDRGSMSMSAGLLGMPSMKRRGRDIHMRHVATPSD